MRCDAESCRWGTADGNRVEVLRQAKEHERMTEHRVGRVFKATQPELPLQVKRDVG